VYAVQAEGSRAISRALQTGDFGSPVPSSTIADSLAVDVPRGGYYALKQLQEYDGECVVVSDQAILKAQRELAAECGLFAEPAASAVLAGFLAVRERIPVDAIVVLLVTGSGLKDTVSAEKGLELEASTPREEP
jgi:threonine synthase